MFVSKSLLVRITPVQPKAIRSLCTWQSKSNPKETATLGAMYNHVLSTISNYKQLKYGQSTLDSGEDAALLVLETLNIPLQGSIPVKQKLEGRKGNMQKTQWIDLGIQKNAEKILTPRETNLILARLEERVSQRKPVAYIVGAAYQQGFRFQVDERVLIPRSFIGEIISSMARIEEEEGSDDLPFDIRQVHHILDLCCGCGALGILASKFFPNVKKLVLADISSDALSCAVKNVTLHNLSSITSLVQGDLFEALSQESPPSNHRFDLIVCNPPYVSAEKMRNLPIEYKKEPQLALAGGDEEGVYLISKILSNAYKYLHPKKGFLILEIGTCKAALEKRYPLFMKEVGWLETDLQEDEVMLASIQSLMKFKEIYT